MYINKAFVLTYPVNRVYESATFWIRSPEWKFLNMPWIRNRVDTKSGFNIVLSGDVTRWSLVLYREYCIQDSNLISRFSLLPVEVACPLQSSSGVILPYFYMQIWRALRRMLSFVASIPRAVLGTTRVNPDACRIRARTGKFDLNTDKCGNENVFFADFKIIMCYIFPSS